MDKGINLKSKEDLIDDSIGDYWNRVQDWLTLVKNPVGMQLDRIMDGVSKQYGTDSAKFVLNDITDPISWELPIKMGRFSFMAVYVDDLHDRMIADYGEVVKFNEDRFDNFKVLESNDISLYIYGKDIDELEFTIKAKMLPVLAKAMVENGENFMNEYQEIEALPESEQDILIYKISKQISNLPKEIQEVFIF